MSLIGWYYLHVNGDIIYKRDLDGTAADIRESDFARALWPFDPTDRSLAWQLLIEARAAGGNEQRIMELAHKWGCTDEDAQNYAQYLGLRLFKDGTNWCATRADFINLQESSAGFGATCLEALSELCKNLGFRPRKMWGATFHDLVKEPPCPPQSR